MVALNSNAKDGNITLFFNSLSITEYIGLVYGLVYTQTTILQLQMKQQPRQPTCCLVVDISRMDVESFQGEQKTY